MKPFPSGSGGKKKAYYLENAMHNTQSTVPENEGSETQIDDPIQLEIDPTDAMEIQSTSSTSSNRPTSQKRKSKSAATIADQTVAEYFRVKKAKLLSKLEADTNQNIDRQQGIKMFLLSLIPELEELSDSQIKLFKRQVLRVIDDISLSGYHQQQPRSSSGLTILTSPTMSDSRVSQIDLTHMSGVNIQTADFYNAFSQGLNNSNM
ncbi:hypothetical protein J6590_085293 [Homalodisca vitripennis]|nr:hypothetical protein J6590_085293 [Homalodisca vitripennis]